MTEVLRGPALRRGLLSATLALVALFATAAVAPAATLTGGPNIVFTADPETDDSVTFDQGADTDDVSIYSSDPIVDVADDNCEPTDDTGRYYLCTDVSTVTASTLDLDDTLDADGLRTIETNLDGGDDADRVYGGDAEDNVKGGAGDDGWVSGDGNGSDSTSDDVVDGGPGEDWVSGGGGDDIVNGGAGDDGRVGGGPGNDVVDGGPGSESGYSPFAGLVRSVNGGPGNDTVRGGDGDDNVFGDCVGYYGDFFCESAEAILGDDDVVIGDAGTDTTGYSTYDRESGDNTVDVDVTLDGVANDGRADEADNVDVENVYVLGDYDETDTGAATVVGDGKANAITTHEIGDPSVSGNDVVTPAGGNDLVSTGYGTDTVNAVDGFADYIDCGEGPFDDADLDTATDVANVDQFDTAVNCEDVNVTQVGELGSENNPPAITWVTPAADGGELNNGDVLEVSATDSDDGIDRVVFLAGTRVLCTVTAAPYRCTFTKTDADVGKATIVAIAIDKAQQSATALRFLNVDRFEASLSSKVSPKRDTSDPRRFRVSGKLTLPAGVSAAEGCQGSVIVRFKAGKKTISTKRPKLRDDCTYRMGKRFTLPGRFDGADKLRVFARFAGNDVLAPDAAKTKKVTVDG